MKYSQIKLIFFAIITIFLTAFIFKWIQYLGDNNYIVEGFDVNSPSYSHTVDLPINTTYSCKNFCGPPARCAITGQQCTADIDCPGCQPNESSKNKVTKPIPGDNDAGKLSFNQTPHYSPLTSGYGTQQRIISKNKFSKPDSPNLGTNTWIDSYKSDEKQYNSIFKPNNLEYAPNYPKRYSMSGDFLLDGPLASNAYLH
jgi:hypothetical protein